jgi:ribose transport system permease protein
MMQRLARIRAESAQQLSLIVVVALICLVFAALSDRFLTYNNLLNISLQASATIIAAVGMTMVIATRGIDLSIGSVANCSVAVGLMLATYGSGSALTLDASGLAYPVALLMGLCLGVLNAIVIIVFRVHPLIVTLGTLALYRGIGLHVTAAASIAVSGDVLGLARGAFLGIGYPVWLALAIAFLGWFTLSHTIFGRRLLALGGSPRSAVESGLKRARLLAIAYILCSVCGAIAGLVIVGRVGIIDTTLGFNFEFTVITAVVLGGTSLFGGRASIVGSVIGAVLLSAIDNGLNLVGANPFIYEVVRGLVLITAISLDAYTSRKGKDQLAADLS